MPESCATLRFSTVGMPEPARVQAVRDLHLRERTLLPAGSNRLNRSSRSPAVYSRSM